MHAIHLKSLNGTEAREIEIEVVGSLSHRASTMLQHLGGHLYSSNQILLLCLRSDQVAKLLESF